jgi:hypothetical protein
VGGLIIALFAEELPESNDEFEFDEFVLLLFGLGKGVLLGMVGAGRLGEGDCAGGSCGGGCVGW